MWDQGFAELFQRGGSVMWPLLGFSIAALALAIERTIVLLARGRSYGRFLAELPPVLDEILREPNRQPLAERRSCLAQVARAYLAHLDSPEKVRTDVVGREASQALASLEQRMNWLSVIGHLAPMLGLLGTVMGLVDAFHQIEELGGQVQPSDLAAGIWEALLTTVFGLTVALPTLAVYYFLDHRTGRIALEMQWLVSYLEEWREREWVSRTVDRAPASAGVTSAR